MLKQPPYSSYLALCEVFPQKNPSWSLWRRDRKGWEGALDSILKKINKDKSIIITRPDKGNGVVILNKKDYIDKTESILNDKSKFKLVNGDWFKYIISLEDKLNRNLRKIKNKLTDTTYNFLFASGSTPGILNGLPKVHKDGCPIRPILSAINTFNYNLAKCFVSICLI